MNCGSAVSTIAEIECGNHSGAAAVGACVVCGVPVCGDCAVTRGGKLFCNDSSHAVFLVRYALLGVAISEFEADIIVSNLKANGISPQFFSPKEFFNFKNDEPDSAVRVFVLKDDHARAVTLLTELELEDFIHLETIQPS
ncbi:MAG: hypothetical protein KGJ59_13305 [Bacteroidota bacterium]|nr:hypothetical protein [Bacteroidota bacterium]